MTDLKISQLPGATALTGAELIELVQGGVNVQSTTSALAGSLFSLFGNPNGGALNASLANQFAWVTGFPSVPGAVYNSQTNIGTGTPWSSVGTLSSQSLNGGGANLGSSVQLLIQTSSSAANGSCDLYNAVFNSTNPASIALVRLASSGLLIGGFTMTLYFVLTTTIVGEQIFMGFVPGLGAIAGTTTPSNLTNMIGLAKDSTDTNLQFMINNGAGVASKTSLGVTHTSLQGHLLRLVITCDGAGNCATTLSDLESGGQTYTISYPAATTKLPAVFSSAGGQVEPHIHINNGGNAAAVAYGLQALFITGGFGSI